jgi:hypothetical protein
MIVLIRRHECCGEELTSSSSALQQIEHRSDGFVERDGTLELKLVFRGAKLFSSYGIPFEDVALSAPQDRVRHFVQRRFELWVVF